MTPGIWLVNATSRRARARASALALGIGLALTAFAGRAACDGGPPAAEGVASAEALFREARALIGRRSYAAACPKLEESLRLDPAPGTLFNLARCYELDGRLASAWKAYRQVVDATRAGGQHAREAVARERVAEIEPRLSFLVVRLGGDSTAPAPPSLSATLDGRELAGAELGAQVPVDRGEHVVVVSAGGKRAWEHRVHVQAEAEILEVDVPALEDDSPSPAAPPPPAAVPEAIPFPQPAEAAVPPPREFLAAGRTGGGLGGQRVAALLVGGTGVVAAAFGAYFGAQAFQLGDQSRRGCGSAGCNPAALQQSRDSHTAGDVSTWSFVGAGALAAAGAVLWLTAPSPAHPGGLVVVPGVSPRAALWLQGRF